jgi:hypothetical protein
MHSEASGNRSHPRRISARQHSTELAIVFFLKKRKENTTCKQSTTSVTLVSSNIVIA